MLDPAFDYDPSTPENNKNYRVYERVATTSGYYYYQKDQPLYFWPYAADDDNLITRVQTIKNDHIHKEYNTGFTCYKYVSIDAEKGIIHLNADIKTRFLKETLKDKIHLNLVTKQS